MGTKKVKPNAGHAAGKAGGRWMPRAEVKAAAKQRRRNDDKKEVKKDVSEASLLRRHDKAPWFARGNKPIEGPVRGSTWEPGTSPSDILCPTCGEPWDKMSPEGSAIMTGRVDKCPSCARFGTAAECVSTGGIAAPPGYGKKSGKPVKKVIMGDANAKKKPAREAYDWASHPGAIMIGDVCSNDKVIFRTGLELTEGIAQYMTAGGNAWVVASNGKSYVVTADTIVKIVPALEALASEDTFISKLDNSLVAELNGSIDKFCIRCQRQRQFVASESKFRCIVCALESERPSDIAESAAPWVPGEDFVSEATMLAPSVSAHMAHYFPDYDPTAKVQIAACGYKGNAASVKLSESPKAVQCKQCEAARQDDQPETPGYKYRSIAPLQPGLGEAIDPTKLDVPIGSPVPPAGSPSVGPNASVKKAVKATARAAAAVPAAGEKQKQAAEMGNLRRDIAAIKKNTTTPPVK